MEPKFQSSFIPRGPVSSSIPTGNMTPVRRKPRDIFSFLSTVIFTLSLVFAGGVFLYKMYLNYSITQMKGELEAAREALEPETVEELIRLNSRIVSTETLVKQHKVLSPIFEFLQASTPKTVRYTKFDFNQTNKGLELTLQGQARGYAALASAADVFNRATTYFSEPVFYDLYLNDGGDVVFTAKALIVPTALSYESYIEKIAQPPVVPIATTTPRVSTTTVATSSAQTR